MTTIEFTSVVCLENMSIKQKQAIIRLARSNPHSLKKLVLGPATFDLPDTYLTFREEFESGEVAHNIYGGISIEGDVST